jgi:hypothetical protein
MKQYKDKEILSIIDQADFEQRAREFKSPFTWGDATAIWIQEETTRATLALTNTPGGGRVIIGIKEDGQKQSVIQGLSDVQLRSFGAYDSIKGTIDSFSTIGINFEIGWGEYKSETIESAKLVVISVAEFDRWPAICKKDGCQHPQNRLILRVGDVYARAIKGPAASIRATEREMFELIQLSADKEIADLRRRSYVANTPPLIQPIVPTSADLYKNQTSDIDEVVI